MVGSLSYILPSNVPNFHIGKRLGAWDMTILASHVCPLVLGNLQPIVDVIFEIDSRFVSGFGEMLVVFVFLC